MNRRPASPALALVDPAVLRLVAAAADCLESARLAMVLGAEVPNRYRPRLTLLAQQVGDYRNQLEGK